MLTHWWDNAIVVWLHSFKTLENEEMRTFKMGLTAFVLMGLVGCASVGETWQNMSKGGQFATIGAGACGGIGKLFFKTDTKNTILTSAVCGIGGGMIGSYLDNKEKQVKAVADANPNISYTRTDNAINMTVKGVTFDSGSASIKSENFETLGDLAKIFAEDKNSILVITGHTDNRGSASFNNQLSVDRANSVKSFLAMQGVSGEHMQSKGVGFSQPVADNNTAQGRAQNRRVTIELKPIVKQG